MRRGESEAATIVRYVVTIDCYDGRLRQTSTIAGHDRLLRVDGAILIRRVLRLFSLVFARFRSWRSDCTYSEEHAGVDLLTSRLP